MTPPETPPSKPGLKRGGQPGNRNALKHALYARYYSEQTRNGLLNLDAKDYLGEVHLLRASMDRLAETLILHDEITPTEMTAMTNAISRASSTMSVLVQRHMLLNTTKDPVYIAWDDVIHEREFFKDGEPPV